MALIPLQKPRNLKPPLAKTVHNLREALYSYKSKTKS